MCFRAYATPEERPRWSEDQLRERWKRLLNDEKPAKINKRATCKFPGCKAKLNWSNTTGLCMDHVHTKYCNCVRCETKRGE